MSTANNDRTTTITINRDSLLFLLFSYPNERQECERERERERESETGRESARARQGDSSNDEGEQDRLRHGRCYGTGMLVLDRSGNGLSVRFVSTHATRKH